VLLAQRHSLLRIGLDDYNRVPGHGAGQDGAGR
jgi:hypothetical protein